MKSLPILTPFSATLLSLVYKMTENTKIFRKKNNSIIWQIKIITNFVPSFNDMQDYTTVHSSSGLGRRPLTAETRVRPPDALQKKEDTSLLKYPLFIFINLI